MTCSYTNDHTQQTSIRVQCFWHFPPGSHCPAARSKKGKLLRARIAFCADSGSMKFTKPMPFAHTIATTTAAFSMRKLKETAKNFWTSFAVVFFRPACALSGFLVLQCCSASTAKSHQWHTNMYIMGLSAWQGCFRFLYPVWAPKTIQWYDSSMRFQVICPPYEHWWISSFPTSVCNSSKSWKQLIPDLRDFLVEWEHETRVQSIHGIVEGHPSCSPATRVILHWYHIDRRFWPSVLWKNSMQQ